MKIAAQQSEGRNTYEQDVGIGAPGGQGSEIVQLMKKQAERKERRGEEDKERENFMLRLMESISRQQTAMTEDLKSAEQEREAREEAISRERYERMEIQNRSSHTRSAADNRTRKKGRVKVAEIDTIR